MCQCLAQAQHPDVGVLRLWGGGSFDDKLQAHTRLIHLVTDALWKLPLSSSPSQASQLVKYESKVDKGMVMPFTPAGVSFQGIFYKVPMPAGAPGYEEAKAAGQEPELTLLTNITGSFRPGVLTALMGVSGAGKVRCGGWVHCL